LTGIIGEYNDVGE